MPDFANAAPALRTARLDLEPVRADQADEAWPKVDDDRMWTYFPALRPASLNELRALYAKWSRGSTNPEQVWWNWLCRERDSRELAGSLQSTIFPAKRVSYLAYAIYPAYQRKGYAREGSLAVIESVRSVFSIDRFFAEVDALNEASCRLAESLGFTRVETRGPAERGHAVRDDEFLYELRF